MSELYKAIDESIGVLKERDLSLFTWMVVRWCLWGNAVKVPIIPAPVGAE